MTTSHIFNLVLPWQRLYATKDISIIKTKTAILLFKKSNDKNKTSNIHIFEDICGDTIFMNVTFKQLKNINIKFHCLQTKYLYNALNTYI